jgi:hypothetical protein
MIDLDRTEQQMLAEIHAGDGTDASASSAMGGAPAAETQLAVEGGTPEALLPTVLETFSARYAALPPDHVFAELNYLVKKGLGNAFKWGNGSDPERTLAVRAVMTDVGAVVAISDQGPGFDVEGVLGRFQRSDAYSRHGGSGFLHFHEAQSVVSYADGGRTLLIRFLCAQEARTAASDGAGAAAASGRVRRHVDLGYRQPGARSRSRGTSDRTGASLPRR